MKRQLVAFTNQNRLDPVSLNEWNRVLSSFQDGTKVTVTIENFIRKKSLGQNNLIHKLFTIIGNELGWEMVDVKDYVKDKWGVFEPITDRNGDETVDEDTGEILMRSKSLTKYSIEEMSKLIEQTYTFAEKYNIRLPRVEDLKNQNLPI